MSEDEFLDLVRMTHEVQEMTKHPGWTYLVDRAAVNISAKQRSVLNGSAKTVEEYKALTGWLDGATFFVNLPNKMEQDLEEQRLERAENDG